MAETKDPSGALFRVAQPKPLRHASVTGTGTVSGTRYRVAAWMHTISWGARAERRRWTRV